MQVVCIVKLNSATDVVWSNDKLMKLEREYNMWQLTGWLGGSTAFIY